MNEALLEILMERIEDLEERVRILEITNGDEDDYLDWDLDDDEDILD